MTALEIIRSRWTWIAAGAVVVAGLGGYAAGRYAAPTKVEETSKTTAATDSTWAMLDKYRRVEAPVRTITIVREAPGKPASPGCEPCPDVKETTITEERGPVVTSTDSLGTFDQTTWADSSTTKTVERERSSFAIDLGAFWPVRDPKLRPSDLQLAAEKRIAGPAWIGLAAQAPTEKLGDLREYRFGVRLRGEF